MKKPFKIIIGVLIVVIIVFAIFAVQFLISAIKTVPKYSVPIFKGSATMLDNIELSKDGEVIDTTYYKATKIVEIPEHRKYKYTYRNYYLIIRFGGPTLGVEQIFLLPSDNANICESDLDVTFDDQSLLFFCKRKHNGYLIKMYYEYNPKLNWEIGSKLQFSYLNEKQQQVKITFISKDDQNITLITREDQEVPLIEKVFYFWYGLENPKDTYYFDEN